MECKNLVLNQLNKELDSAREYADICQIDVRFRAMAENNLKNAKILRGMLLKEFKGKENWTDFEQKYKKKVAIIKAIIQ